MKKKYPFSHLYNTNRKEYFRLVATEFRKNNPDYQDRYRTKPKDISKVIIQNIFDELPSDVIPVTDFPTYYARPNGEIWRDTRGVKSAIKCGKARVLRLTPTFNSHNGYWIIQPYKDGKKLALHLHRFILTAFKGPAPEIGMECHHIDADTSNNTIDNLMWVTRQQNADFVDPKKRRVKKITLSEGRKVSDTKYSHLYPQIVELYNSGISVTKIARILDIPASTTEHTIKKFVSEGTINRIKRKHSNQVNQYDLEGNFIKIWNNAKDAAEYITGKRAGSSMITENCNNGRCKTAYGFIWKWA